MNNDILDGLINSLVAKNYLYLLTESVTHNCVELHIAYTYKNSIFFCDVICDIVNGEIDLFYSKCNFDNVNVEVDAFHVPDEKTKELTSLLTECVVHYFK